MGLGIDVFGAYSTATTLVSVILLFSSLGLDSYLIREISRNPDKRNQLFLDVSLLKFISNIFFIIIFLVLFPVINASFSEITISVIYIIIFSIVLDGFNHSAASFFFGQEKMMQGSVIGFFQSFLNFILLIICFYEKLPVNSYFISVIFASFFVGLTSFIFTSKYLFFGSNIVRNRSKEFPSILRKSIPFMALSFLLVLYYKIDIFLLNYYIGDKAVGIYNAAYRVIDALMFLPSALMGALFPAVSKDIFTSSHSLNLMIQKLIKMMGLIGIPASLGVFFISPNLTHLLYGVEWKVDELNSTAQVLQILIFAWMLIFINAICPVILNARGKTIINSVITFIGVIINILFNIYLIPKLGVRGAALSTVLTEIILTIIYYSIIIREYGNLHMLTNLKHGLTGSLIMSIILLLFFYKKYITSFWFLLLLVIIGFITYIAYLFLLKIISINQIKKTLLKFQ